MALVPHVVRENDYTSTGKNIQRAQTPQSVLVVQAEPIYPEDSPAPQDGCLES